MNLLLLSTLLVLTISFLLVFVGWWAVVSLCVRLLAPVPPRVYQGQALPRAKRLPWSWE